MRLAELAVTTLLLAACNSDGKPSSDPASTVKDLVSDRVGAATDFATEQAGAAKTLASKQMQAVKTTALETSAAVGERFAAAYATGKRVKAELDKVYKTTLAYDLAVEDLAASSAAGEAHAKELAALPNVTVGGAQIGYREDVSRSVGGVTYSKHFRATWRRGDRVYRVSYFTSERFDVAAFADLLQRLVPVVEKVV